MAQNNREIKKIPQARYEQLHLKNSFWKSSLFNSVYLEQDIYRLYPEKWNLDGDPHFESYIDGLLNLFTSWDENHIKNWTEVETIANWIKPILIQLGWSKINSNFQHPFAEQTPLAVKKENNTQTYYTDLLITDNLDDLALLRNKKWNAAQRLDKAREHVLLPVEAKYWNRLNKLAARRITRTEEKTKTLKPDAAHCLGPNGQIIKYMELLDTEWGLLTDGATWRLFNKKLSLDSEQRYLEFNVYNLYKRAELAMQNECDLELFRQAAKFFYNFFSKSALFPKNKKQELVQKALLESKSYADSVEENLKYRFVSAMTLICNAYQKTIKKNNNLALIRIVAENHLFNILFIKSCEARNILPLDANQYWNLSLSRLIDALHSYSPEEFENHPNLVLKKLTRAFFWFDYQHDGFELYDSLIRLSKLLHHGSHGKGKGFYIEGFNQSVFTKKEWDFALQHKLRNIEMVQILFELGFSKAPKSSQCDYQEIPYQYFTPRQLGSIYESFLEYQVHRADEDLIYRDGKWEKANLNSLKVSKINAPKVRQGELYFTRNNQDRKSSGAYYTPQFIVRYIIQETLSTFCDGKSSKDIENITVCDPALGSGHFLNECLNFLTKKYLEAQDNEILDDCTSDPILVKRKILKCLYGIDSNPRAVKLACMSLWLESAYPGRKLQNLNSQLITRDSLTEFDLKKDFNNIAKEGGFTAVVGNPPYVRSKQLDSDYRLSLKKNYQSATGLYDVYVCFIEMINQILKPNGQAGYITPSKYIQLDFGKGIRHYIRNNLSLMKFIDFADNKLFQEAATYCAISIFSNRKNLDLKYYLFPHKSNKVNLEEELFLLSDKNFDTFPQSHLEEETWSFSNTKVVDFSEHHIKLSDLSEKIFQGLVLTPTQVFPVYLPILKSHENFKEKEVYFIEQIKTKVTGYCEGELLIPILKSSDIHREQYRFKNYYAVFPYQRDNNFELFTHKEIMQNYPKALNYFKKSKEYLITREKGKFSNTQEWYQYSRVQNFDCHQRRKILTPGLAKEPRFVIEDGNFFIDQGSYGIILKDQYKHLEAAILNYLNSERVKSYIESVSPILSGGYYNYQTKYLKDLPIDIKSIHKWNEKLNKRPA